MKSKRDATQTVQGCFSARGPQKTLGSWGRGERPGYLQWASNAEPTYITGSQLMFRIDTRASTKDYSLAKKNYPVLPELSSNKGFTLIEILISTGILLVAVAGFLAWTANIVNHRVQISKRNFAYNIAVDVSDRLAKLNGTNVLLLPNTGNNKYLGVDSNDPNPLNNGNLLTCLGGAITNNSLVFDATGMTQYTNPWNGTSNNLFLYHDSQGSFSASAPLTPTANAYIDHPNSTDVANLGSSNDINTVINPIRHSINGVTYYVVWSVAYMPCATAPTNLVKIFITVYWIEPEPSSSTVAAVISGLQSGALTVKNVSITLDKSLTATQ